MMDRFFFTRFFNHRFWWIPYRSGIFAQAMGAHTLEDCGAQSAMKLSSLYSPSTSFLIFQVLSWEEPVRL
jgi:hypothetical protein